MSTTTVTLPTGAAVYHRSPATAPAGSIERDRLIQQNIAILAAAINTLSLANAITDPGASGAIPVTASGYCPIVTAATESRTLAVPAFAGQQLLLVLKTTAGDCTITVAQAIDEYGATSIVLHAAGDAVLLEGVNSGSNLRWRVASNRGVASIPTRGPLETAIADPGASGAIAVVTSGHVEIVTAASETRTLAAPSFNGQMMLISCKTRAVGNAVITCATTFNATGNNTLTLSAAGQAVLLAAKQSGSSLLWSVVSNDGAALTTV